MTTNQCQSKKNLRSKDLLCLRLLANCYYRVLVCTVFLYLCCIWYPWLCIFVASTSVRDQMAWRPTRVRATERGESECERGWKGFEKATLQYSAWCWTRKRNKCIQTARSKLQAMKHTGGSIQGRGGRVEVNMGCHLGKWRLCCKSEHYSQFEFLWVKEKC